MRDELIDRLARVLVGYSLEVRPGDLVVIEGGVAAAPVLAAVNRQVIAAGGIPAVLPELPGMREALLLEGSDDQLRAITPFERVAAEQADCWLRVGATENTRAATDIDPRRQQLFQRARAQVFQTRLERAASGALRWSSTIYPTNAYAQEANLSLRDFEAFVARAGWLDDPDPSARWRALGAYQARLVDWLTPRREVHVVAEDTDLHLSIAGRVWNNSDGHRNFPSGEVFTGPVEDSVNGHIRFSFPSVIQGRQVEEVRLWFEQGRVVRAEATRNNDFLQSMLDTDEGARRLGEFAFGTNRRIDRYIGNTLFDEKIGGTIHMALGSGYPDTGSKNRSAIHWDLICDLRAGGEVTVDGALFLKNGRIVIDESRPGDISESE